MSTERTRRYPLADRRGAALALALWLLLVLGFASLQVLAEVRVRLDAAALDRSRTVARYASESGVEAARALLEQVLHDSTASPGQALVFPELRRRVDAWGVAASGSGRYQVVVDDVNGRIDLNRARPVVLRALFEQFVSAAEAERLLTSLRGPEAAREAFALGAETDAGSGPTQPSGELADFAPAGTFGQTDEPPPPLRHLEELLRVPGFDEELAATLAPHVTVDGDGLVDVNVASSIVLASIPGLGAMGAQSLVAARARSGPFRSRVAVYSALSEGGPAGVDTQMPDLITTPRRVRVIARGWEDGRPYTHEIQAVFEVLTSSLVVGSRVRLRSLSERSR